MKRSWLKFLLAALAVVTVGAVALAQESGAAADLGARIAELQARAQRLSVLAELPAEARPEVEALMGRYDDLRRAGEEVEVARLEALVAALEAGESPTVARQMAEAAVSERRVELTRQREALDADVDALVERFPDAANTIRRLLAQRTIVAGVRVGGGSGTFMALPALPDMAGGGTVFHFRAPELEGTLRELPDTFRRLLPQVRPGR